MTVAPFRVVVPVPKMIFPPDAGPVNVPDVSVNAASEVTCPAVPFTVTVAFGLFNVRPMHRVVVALDVYETAIVSVPPMDRIAVPPPEPTP